MAAFATPDDLADYLGRDRFAEPTEYRQAVLLLDLASAEIRAWTRQTIDLVSGDAVMLAGTWRDTLVLPEQPVVSVSSVAVDGTTLGATDYTLVAGTLVAGAATSFLDIGASPQGGTGVHAGNWGGPGARVAVTYTHGFSTVPGSVKAATLAVAARMVSGSVGVRQEAIAGYSVTYANPGATSALSDGEKASLRWLRRWSL